MERVVSVAGGRLGRWVEGFGERHGGAPSVAREGAALVLTAPDGATASCTAAFPMPAAVVDVPGLQEWALVPRRCAVLLVRRGGYACAVVDMSRPGAGAVVASKVGTRYVQSRTAAGGWSQQRFARRRENQARDLSRAVADHAVRLLASADAEAHAQWLVTGGDRPLVDTVLADPRLRAVAELPRGPHLTMGDPKAADVRDLPQRLTEVRIRLVP